MIDLADPEVRFAIDAVRETAVLARQVQQQMLIPALSKEDRTPVTVADYAVQALVGRALKSAFPEDPLVAEEDSERLSSPKGQDTLKQVTEFVAPVAEDVTPEEICQWIDRGTSEPGQRFWALDPIDGTKGFLRGAQYAVVLALVVDGNCQLGVMGCPTLNGGSLVAAARGQRSWTAPLEQPDQFEPLTVSRQQDPSGARVLSSYESAHTNSGQLDELLRQLGGKTRLIRMDSQTKHVVLAAGEADLMLRLLSSKQPEYREKIWDQVAGSLIIEEAGGRVTDLEGKALDFSAGRTLLRNRGILASNGYLHDAVLEMTTRQSRQ